MKIKILKTVLLTAGVFKTGEIVNLSDSAAINLIDAGYATLKLEECKKVPKESKAQEKMQIAETEKPETEVKHASKSGSTSQRAETAPKS